MAKPILTYNEERRPRTTIYASDWGRLESDIICALKQIPETNPTLWNNTLRMFAGKAVEEQMIKIMIENGIADPNYNQDTAITTEIQRYDTPIRMKFDALGKKGILKAQHSVLPNSLDIEINDGEPIEIKSINNANAMDVARYNDNKPRENYVGQLATYMDALGKERGHLFVASVDGLNYFWFVCEHQGNGVYKCGDTVVDVNVEYKRYAEIWKKFKDGVEPNWTEELYKLPIDQIQWKMLTKSKIGDARNNYKVIGSENSYKILYSNYCDLILEKQGVKTRGYTDEELKIINEKTIGYTTWDKQK